MEIQLKLQEHMRNKYIYRESSYTGSTIMQDVMSVNQKEYIDGPTIYDLMKNDAMKDL